MKSNAKNIPSRPDPATIQSMFDTIAPTYDILNHLLSFGFDIRWRKKAIKILSEKGEGTILDIAAGSGDLSIEAMTIRPKLIVASDFAFKMLKVFQKKINLLENSSIINLISCDALRLPFKDESFDATIVAFGIRNFSKRCASLCEMLRVLKPNGLSVILELSKPNRPILFSLFNFYSRFFLPLFGKMISRHNYAYRYLPESIETFLDKEEFLTLMTKAGFSNVESESLTFGIATIYFGRKSSFMSV